MKAWHFVNNTLRDGRPIPPDGVKLIHDGDLVMCESGLHASKNILDALKYAPGNVVCRVEVGGKIIKGDDKLVCSERTILWRVDAEDVLRKFARLCALDVINLWNAPAVVVDYLKTGNNEIRDAAMAAAMAAARAAARGEALAITRIGMWNAGTFSAAGWSAVWSMAANEAWSAAVDAAWGAAWDAKKVELDSKTFDRMRAKQSKRLYAMVMHKKRRENNGKN